MENVIGTLRAPRHPVFQLHTEQSHPRLSVLRVLRVRFLRWLEKASPQAIWKVIKWASMSLVFSFLWFMPEETFQLTLHLLRWNSGRIPLFLMLLAFLLNAKRLWLWHKRRSVKQRGENQYLFEGVPVGELASFLKNHESFKLADAKELGIGPKQWQRMSAEMKKRGLLVHGDNNAQVLRPIGMTNLVRQLRDNDLIWSEDANCFVEKIGGFSRWHLDREFQQKRITEQIEKKERKLARIEEKIEQAGEHPLFSALAA